MLYGIMVLVVAAITTFVTVTIYCLNTWRGSIERAKIMSGTRNRIRIRFKEFIRFYAVLPDNLHLYKDYCLCQFVHGHGYKTYCITFSFLDFVRYRIWRKILATIDKRKMELSVKTVFCKDMRKAIFETNKDIEKEIEDCARQFRDITKRNF